MKASEFCYWLQGFFEIRGEASPEKRLTGEQVAMIQRHLSMVFIHDLDPKQGTQSHQEALQALHDGAAKIGGTGPNGEIFRC